MTLTVNGEAVTIREMLTVAELLSDLGYPAQGVAVALDGALVPRSRWDTEVPLGAEVEVVTAVQGG